MLTTSQKGAVAETAIAYAATRLGIDVYRPVADGGRCDLIFDLGPRLLRVQCKTARQRGGVLAIPCYSARRTASGFVKRSYTSNDVDAIAAYSPDLERCYLLPITRFADRMYVQLRLVATRNNQRSGIRWAADYELESLDLGHTTGP